MSKKEDKQHEEWLSKQDMENLDIHYINHIDSMQLIGMGPLDKDTWLRLVFDAEQVREKEGLE